MKRVAIVEDNPDNRLLVRVLLEDLYRIEEFENGPDALTSFIADAPDLVLLDISLPGMDGLEVLSRIRSTPALASLPVVALTAHAGPADKAKYLDAGFDEYMTKPIVDESILLDIVRRQLADK